MTEFDGRAVETGTLRDIVRRQVDHIETGFVPYTLGFEKPVERMLDAHYGGPGWKESLLKSVYTVGGTFDSWNTMVRRGDEEGAQSVDAYGSVWTLKEDISHLDEPVLERVGFDEYAFPTKADFLLPGKWDRMVQACESNRDRYLVGAAGAGPFELYWRLTGIERMLIEIVEMPERFQEILDRLSELILGFIDECVQLPVDAVMLGDDWCDQRGCLIGVERWRRFFKPLYAKYYERIHRSGKKTVLHVCGRVVELIPDLIEVGLDILESVQPEPEGMDPFHLKKEFGQDLTFWGGLGCQGTVTFGTPAQLASDIRNLRTRMSVGGGYILAPAKSINGSVPLANAVAIFETFIEENGKFPQARKL
jgi:uroporphyrinogen decarboxylase